MTARQFGSILDSLAVYYNRGFAYSLKGDRVRPGGFARARELGYTGRPSAVPMIEGEFY